MILEELPDKPRLERNCKMDERWEQWEIWLHEVGRIIKMKETSIMFRIIISCILMVLEWTDSWNFLAVFINELCFCLIHFNYYLPSLSGNPVGSWLHLWSSVLVTWWSLHTEKTCYFLLLLQSRLCQGIFAGTVARLEGVTVCLRD